MVLPGQKNLRIFRFQSPLFSLFLYVSLDELNYSLCVMSREFVRGK
jgi:hypothetical protein